jgi:hypothetical protein
MKVAKVTGVSMLCCVPGWGDFLSNMPRRLCSFLLITLDGIARLLPWLSDVLVIRCSQK